jgi:hypothetical protein
MVTRTIIELNDSEVVVARGGKILARSPGVAVIGRDRIELGTSAAKVAHLDPRNTFNRFWNNLNQDRLRLPTDRARHHADLAFAHLLALYEQSGKPSEVVFCVPGSFTTEQLSLLAGLVQASPFSIIGLVDTAVAAAAARVGAGTYDHVDVHLHHAVVTTLEVSEYVERVAVNVVDGAGIASIHDRCAGFIADEFVRQTRFDPMHLAQTEQALYDQIPRCLATLRGQHETVMDVPLDQSRHKVRVLREPLVKRLEPLYEQIVSAVNPAHVCLMAKRANELPLLCDRLRDSRALDEQAPFDGCTQLAVSPPSPERGVSFVTRLRAASVRSDATAATGQRGRGERPERVTHLLLNHRAYPLSGSPVHVSEDATVTENLRPDSICTAVLDDSVARLEPGRGEDVRLNGRRVTGAVDLQLGDSVTFGKSGVVITGINVVASNGPS